MIVAEPREKQPPLGNLDHKTPPGEVEGARHISDPSVGLHLGRSGGLDQSLTEVVGVQDLCGNIEVSSQTDSMGGGRFYRQVTSN